jgi:hypothetical protein
MPDGTTLNVATLAAEKKALFLCVLGTRLTVSSRELYVDEQPAEGMTRQGRAFTEMFHKIFGQLDHVLDKSEQGYPDDIFEAVLTEMATENGILDKFRKAWDSARDYVSQHS